MGRRWRAWWRPGERGWWWRGLGVVDGYGRRGERGARRGLWGEGEVDVGRRWRAWRRRGEQERWWRGLRVGVLYGRRREVEVDMGRRWRSWWRPGERERRERGPGGRGGTWGSGNGASGWLRRGGGVGSVGAGGECAVRGGSGSAAVCETGPHRSSLASQDAWGGFAWCHLVLGGGPRSPVAHGSATLGCGGGSNWWYGSSDCPWRGWARGAPSAWTCWPGGYSF